MKEFFSSFFSSANIIVRAKALKQNAFALTGRLWFSSSYFPGRCPGLLATALLGRATVLLTPSLNPIGFAPISGLWIKVFVKALPITNLK